MGDSRAELARLTAPLLDPASTVGDAFQAVSALEPFLAGHTPFRQAESIGEGESFTPGGWAISPTEAALCAREFRRTHLFALGVYRAIQEAERRRDSAPIRVLYAGCGPWALLALPSLAALLPERVRFTLLDLHEPSIASVRALVASLGAEPWIDDIVQADAATWQIPEALTPHVIVTETMNVALEREPQVAITRNLLGQAPDALLVPHSVRVDLRWMDPRTERPRLLDDGTVVPAAPRHTPLGEVFRVDGDRVASWFPDERETLPAARLRIPSAPSDGGGGGATPTEPLELRLYTTVETWPGLILDAWESTLTEPRPLIGRGGRSPGGTGAKTPSDAVPSAPDTLLAFRYRLGERPGLEWSAYPDRVRLPFTFDPARLEADLAALEGSEWVDHFVKENYEGRWSVLPLRAPRGTEEEHPILQIVSHPGVTDYVDTPLQARLPYLAQVLRELGFPLGSARLMTLDPGSVIRTHIDPDLAAEEGWARIHIPLRTNPGVEFLVNGRPVTMGVGECWYLRLSDPHSVRNDGAEPRVHLVIDAPVGPELAPLLREDGSPISSRHASQGAFVHSA